ncbi:MAG: MBG domain-containing protein, partial [Anaeroplasmataceae bacterium]
SKHVLITAKSLATETSFARKYGFTYTIEDNNYNTIVSNKDDLVYTVTPRNIIINLDSKTSIYGNKIETLSYTVTSESKVINNDYIGLLSTTATPTSNVDSYEISFVKTNDSYNVEVSNNNATIYTITQRSISVEVETLTTQYGDKIDELTYKVVKGSLVNDSDVLLTVNSVATTKSGVDSYGFTYFVEDNNYDIEIINIDAKVHEITKRDISIEINAATSSQGEKLAKLTYEVVSEKGIVNDDFIGKLETDATPSSTVGKYPIRFVPLDTNYNVIVTNDGELLYSLVYTIINILVESNESQYGDDIKSLTFVVVGSDVTVPDNVITFKLNATSTSDVGSYGFTYFIEDDNYSFNVINKDELIYKITPRELTIDINESSSEYGYKLSDLSYTVTSIRQIIEADVIGDLSTEALISSIVGKYSITFNSTNDNYLISVSNNNEDLYEIVQRKISISVDNNSSQYGDKTKELTYTIISGSLVDIKHVLISAKTVATTKSSVGSYGFTFTIEDSNYDVLITNIDATIYEITQREISIEINKASSVYEANISELTYEVMSDKGIVNNDTIGTLTTDATNTSAVGNYKITFTPNNNNYKVTVLNVDNLLYSIVEGIIYVEVIANSSQYGDELNKLEYKVLDNNRNLPNLMVITVNATSTSNVGKYGFTYVLEDSNYTVIVTNENDHVYEIVQREVSITIDSKTSIYGNAIEEFKFTVNGDVTVLENDRIGTLTSDVKFDSNVGSYNVLFTKTNNNYNVTVTNPNELTYTITQRAIEVTVDSMSSEYGDDILALTYTITKGTLVDDKHVLISATSKATNKNDVGTYGFTYFIEDNNYSVKVLNEKDEVYSITQREIEITINSVSSVFNEKLTELTYEVVSEKGIVNNDTIGTLSTTASNTSDVGKYEISFTKTDANYKVDVTNNNELLYSIVLSVINITVESNSSVYGEEVKALTYKVEGDYQDLPVLITAVSKATSTSSVGKYGFTFIVEDSNYSVNVLNKDELIYEITARDITISLDSKSSQYGNDTVDLTYSVTGSNSVIGKDIIGDLTTEATNISVVGEYSISFVKTNENYNIEVTNNNALIYTILKREISVSVTPNSSQYGDDTNDLDYSIVQGTLVNELDILISAKTVATNKDSVNKYTFTFVIENSNYDVKVINEGEEIYSIIKREIEIEIQTATSIYNEALAELTYEVLSEKGIVNNDIIGTLSTDATITSNVGIYKITFTPSNSNYNVTVENNNASLYTIVSGVIEITVESNSSVYGEEVKALTYKVKGDDSGLPILITATTKATSRSRVGKYGFTYVVEASNYLIKVLNEDELVYEITQREVTIELEDTYSIYGNDIAEVTYKVTSDFDVLSKDIIGQITTTATNLSEVNKYAVNFTKTNDNYIVNVTNNGAIIYEIIQRRITVSVDNASSQYGDDVKQLTYTVVDGSKVSDDHILLSIFTTVTNKSEVGTYGYTYTLENSNYNVRVINVGDEVYEITQREIEIELLKASSVYQEELAKLEFEVLSEKGIVNNDIIGTLSTTASNTSEVGKYVITFTKTNNNYKIHVTNNNAELYSIVLGIVNVEVVASSSQYGDSIKKLTYKVIGDATGLPEVLITITPLASSTSIVGKYGFTYVIEDSNYTINVINEDELVYEITQREVSITLDNVSSVYGNELEELTFTVTSEKSIIAGQTIGLLTTEATNLSDVNTYKINFTKTNDNYLVSVSNNDQKLYEIVKRKISVTVTANSSQYGDDINEMTYVISKGELVLDTHVLISVSTKATSLSNIGTYGFNVVVEDNNYDVLVINKDELIYSIAKREISIELEKASSIYGNKLADLNFNVVSDKNIINNDVVGILSTSATDRSNVGKYAITFNPSNDNYKVNVSNNNASIYIISKRVIEVEIQNTESQYGNDVIELTYKVTKGELVDSKHILITVTTLATSTSNIGKYGFTYFVEDSNYETIVTNKDDLLYEITERQIEITLKATESIYGFEISKLEFDVTSVAQIVNEDIIGTVTTDATNTSVVEKYAMSFTKTNDNYLVTVKNDNDKIYEIKQRPISIMVDEITSQYGDEVDTLTYSIIDGELVDSKHILIEAKTVATTKDGVSKYGFSYVIEDSNYDINVINEGEEIHTIVQREITIEIDSISSVQGDDLATLTFEVLSEKGIVNNDTIGKLETEAKSDSEAGAYKITFTPDNTNYKVTVTNNNAQIYFIVLGFIDIKVVAATSVYGDNIKELKYELVGNYTNIPENLITIIVDASSSSNVGTYGFKYIIENSDYAINVINKDEKIYTITPREIAITLDDTSSTYGDELSKIEYTVSSDNKVIEDDIIGIFTTEATRLSDVGTYKIMFTQDNDNYIVIVNNVNNTAYSITQRDITVIVENFTSTYGEEFGELLYTITEGSLVDESHVLIKVTSKALINSNVGSYGFDVFIEDSNYNTIISNIGTDVHSIIERVVDIQINKSSSIYGNELSELSFIVSSEVNIYNEDIIGELSTTATELSDVGIYVISFKKTNDNYKINVINNDFELYEIIQKNIEIKVDSVSTMYGEEILELTYEVVNGKLVSEDHILIRIMIDINNKSTVGSYGFEYEIVDNNYNAIVLNKDAKVYTITHRLVDIHVDLQEITYGDKIQNNTFTQVGDISILEGDIIGKVVPNVSGLADANKYLVSFISENDNYLVSIVNEDLYLLVVSKKDIQITIDEASSVYGDLISSLTYTTNGELVDPTHVLVTLSTHATSKSNVGEYKINVFIENNNYNINVTNEDAVYTITARSITLEIEDKYSIVNGLKLTLNYKVTDGRFVYNDANDFSITSDYDINTIGVYPIVPVFSNSNYKPVVIQGNYHVLDASLENAVKAVKSSLPDYPLYIDYNPTQQDVLDLISESLDNKFHLSFKENTYSFKMGTKTTNGLVEGTLIISDSSRAVAEVDIKIATPYVPEIGLVTITSFNFIYVVIAIVISLAIILPIGLATYTLGKRNSESVRFKK